MLDATEPFIEAEKSFKKLRGSADLKILKKAFVPQPNNSKNPHNHHVYCLKPATEFGTSPNQVPPLGERLMKPLYFAANPGGRGRLIEHCSCANVFLIFLPCGVD